MSRSWSMTVTFCGAIILAAVVQAAEPMVSPSHKGSLLMYPSVELAWNASGELVQDTFLHLANDYPDDVWIQFYFINGDPPIDEIRSPSNPTVILREAEPGWNKADCLLHLTANQAVYWSAGTGIGTVGASCQPFAVLDPGGRPDPESTNGRRVLRGYTLAWAVDPLGAEINWNQLTGHATIIEYDRGTAWDYEPYAWQALKGTVGQPPDDNPGQLILNGSEYETCPGALVMDFLASGSTALSGGGQTVMVDSDLTLVPPEVDLRMVAFDLFTTVAVIDVWNEFEAKLSGMQRRITCWDQTLLSQYGFINNFTRAILRTDRGKARIDGVASTQCFTFAVPAALVGVIKREIAFSGVAERYETSGVVLTGMGCEDASIIYDVQNLPPDPIKRQRSRVVDQRDPAPNETKNAGQRTTVARTPKGGDGR